MPNGHFHLSMVDVAPDSDWPNPGLYRDVDVDRYDALSDRASAPILRTIHTRTPAHARALMDGEIEPAEEKVFNARMQEAILAPDRFLANHAVDVRCPATASDGSRCERSGRIPYRSQEGELMWFCDQPSHHPDNPEANPIEYECCFCDAEPGDACKTLSGAKTDPHADRRAKAQAWSSTAYSGNLPSPSQADVQTISETEAAKIGAMRDALRDHPSASQLLFEASGYEEVAILFDHQRTGVPCKTRMDRLVSHQRSGAMIVDYKVNAMPVDYKIVENAQPGPHEFGRLIEKHRYDMRGQFHRLACESRGPHIRSVAIVAQEKEPPYAVGVHLFPLRQEYDETVADLEGAEDDVLNALHEFKQCTVDGEWPAYSDSLLLARVPSDADAGGRE
jgi:hypothetical protein